MRTFSDNKVMKPKCEEKLNKKSFVCGKQHFGDNPSMSHSDPEPINQIQALDSAGPIKQEWCWAYFNY